MRVSGLRALRPAPLNLVVLFNWGGKQTVRGDDKRTTRY